MTRGRSLAVPSIRAWGGVLVNGELKSASRQLIVTARVSRLNAQWLGPLIRASLIPMEKFLATGAVDEGI